MNKRGKIFLIFLGVCLIFITMLFLHNVSSQEQNCVDTSTTRECIGDSRTLEVFAPRYNDNGTWREVDFTIRSSESKDHEYDILTGNYKVEIKNNSHILINEDSNSFNISLPYPILLVENNYVLYDISDTSVNATLNYSFTAKQVNKLITIHGLKTSREDRKENYNFKEDYSRLGQNNAFKIIEEITAEDEDKIDYKNRTEFRKTDNSTEIILDLSVLKEAKFPIYLDPPLEITSGTTDLGGDLEYDYVDILAGATLRVNDSFDYLQITVAEGGYFNNSGTVSGNGDELIGRNGEAGKNIYINSDNIIINGSVNSFGQPGTSSCGGGQSCHGGHGGNAGNVSLFGKVVITDLASFNLGGGNGGNSACSGGDSRNGGNAGNGGNYSALHGIGFSNTSTSFDLDAGNIGVSCGGTGNPGSPGDDGITYYQDVFAPQIEIDSLTSSQETLTFTVDATILDSDLDVCTYNVTGEINTTVFTCNTLFQNTVGDFGTYDLTIFANDTTGNSTILATQFTISEPVVSDGGGGGGASVVGLSLADNFTIETRNGQKLLDLVLAKDSTRPRTVSFFLRNSNIEPVTVQISCNTEEVNESTGSVDICEYVSFDKVEVTIPPNEQSRVEGTLSLKTPPNSQIGDEFYFNVVVVSGTEFSKLSVSSKVTFFGLIYKWNYYPFQSDKDPGDRSSYPAFALGLILFLFLMALGILISAKIDIAFLGFIVSLIISLGALILVLIVV